MKTKYYCEMCGKEFENEREAIECEQRHAEEDRKQKEVEKNKNYLIEQANYNFENGMAYINELRKKYPSTYVDIDYDGGTAKVRMSKIFNDLISLLMEDL